MVELTPSGCTRRLIFKSEAQVNHGLQDGSANRAQHGETSIPLRG